MTLTVEHVAWGLALGVSAFLAVIFVRAWRRGRRIAAASAHFAHQRQRTMRGQTPRCYCGKKARRVTEYAGRRLPVCSAWCAGRLPSKVATLRGRT